MIPLFAFYAVVMLAALVFALGAAVAWIAICIAVRIRVGEWPDLGDLEG
jgi:hypothetical protein